MQIKHIEPKQLRPHPLANRVPPLASDALGRLETDIAVHGVLEPLHVASDGQTILDGHHRHQIALRLKLATVPVRQAVLGDRSPALYLLDCALNRRNLTGDQIAYLVVERVEEEERLAAARKAEQAKAQAAQQAQQGKKHFQRIVAPGPQSIDKRNAAKPASKAAPQPVAAKPQPAKELRQPPTRDRIAKEHGASPKIVRHILAIKRSPTLTEKRRETLLEEIRTSPEPGVASRIVRGLREEKREQARQVNAQAAKATPDPVAAGVKFTTILADPPWDWGDEGDVNQMGRAKPDYATMPFEDLLRLKVAEMADDNAHLYLWVTNRSLLKAGNLLEAWGFRYVTCLTWPKTHFGMGNYFRGQTEQILFGVRGSLQLKRKDASTLLPTWKRGKAHSAKPVEIYEFIESCSPGPYLELFSRTKRDGWTQWGADAHV